MVNMENVKDKSVRKFPLIIKRKDIVSDKSNYELVWRCVTKPQYKEDVIYKASANDFLKGKFPNLVLVNKLNVEKNDNRTIATYSSNNHSSVELTSDGITRLIGQENYNTLLAALCSVISQDLRIQGILSLLTPDVKECVAKSEPDSATLISSCIKTKLVHTETQTDHSSMNLLIKDKQRKKRMKKQQVRSYIPLTEEPDVKKLRKVVVNPNKKVNSKMPNNVVEYNQSKETPSVNYASKKNLDAPGDLQDIKAIVDEDSNMSTGSWGQFSLASHDIPDSVLNNCSSIINNINDHTEAGTKLKLYDGSELTIRAKFEDQFHYVTEEVLSQLNPYEQQKLKLHQIHVDYTYCLLRDEDHNMLLHNAVLNNDLDLLRRQCIMLKKRGETIDVLGAGSLTALQMSIFQDNPQCTALLLRYGADPLITDDEGRTALHLAAEVDVTHLDAIINHCQNNARKVLKENDEIWNPEMETQPDDELSNYLLRRMSILCDSQGYTPLMLASKLGLAKSVELLTKASPSTINMKMPNCGNTALYLAVGSACLDASNRGNKSTVSENFKKTVEVLVVNGADPSIDNSSGSNVNFLLTECCISELSMLIANKLTSVNFFNGNDVKNFDSYILLKDSQGKVGIADRKSREPKNCKIKEASQLVKKAIKEEQDIHGTGITHTIKNDIDSHNDKPIILQNIAILPKNDPVKKSNINYKPVSVIQKTVGVTPEIIILHKNEKKMVVQRSQVNSNPTLVKILPKATHPNIKMASNVKNNTKRLSDFKAGPSSNKKLKKV